MALFGAPNYVLCVFLVIFCVVKSDKKCSKALNDYETYLGTKTPYRIVANYSTSEIKYDDCKAVKLWAMVRHGTRNPNVKLIERMNTRLVEIRDAILENFPEGNGEINNFDLDLFRGWSPKLEANDEKKLTHEGEDEMVLLAERLQSRFPGILTSVYSDSAFKFKFTATQRTKKSAQAFAAGLFGRNVVKDISFPEPLKKDPILRFYKLCNKWRKEVSKNPKALEERTKFENSATMTKTIEGINKRLGFDNEFDFSDVHAMYMTCAFETAWNKRKRSPWCSVFSNDDFKVMEYAEDLKYYWIDGYGHELTYKQACPALTNMIEFFQTNESLPKSTVYFTHSGTLLKMLAHLELYKEEKHLLADDYDKNSDRNWKVSQIDSFGTNLIFILFDCQGRKKVLTMHQEDIVRLQSCPNSDLCDFDTFINYYNKDLECPFDTMCENEL
ncbi:multiple inositol polyphosphate phosphatase 1 [Tribolium castaneum]|nr:PREDICTED: LOW QUALITY PROTEIN: multiple inositol polyphosphate phosphatase 1 [Tribolium castaneum]|eukprot:XP_015838212.1 PREDICTED: LOW QUALITY PROTEIN: multiple inositol polyphosphate phosphatase 1 [Tribolium castaneum]